MIVGRWCVPLLALAFAIMCLYNVLLVSSVPFKYILLVPSVPFFFNVTECIVCVTDHDPLTFFPVVLFLF